MLYVRVFIQRMRLNKHLMKALSVQLVLHMFPDLLVSLLLSYLYLKSTTFYPFLCLCVVCLHTFSTVESPMMSAFKIKEPGMSHLLYVPFPFGLSWWITLCYIIIYKCLTQFKMFPLQSHSSIAWKVSGLRRQECLYCVVFPCHHCISAGSDVHD